MTTFARTLPACIALLLCASTLQAQPSLTFVGAEHPPVPLDAAQQFTVGVDGQIQATCLFQTGSSACRGIGVPSAQPIPSVTLSATGLIQDAQGRFQINAGQQISVVRSVTNNPHVCVATASSGVTGWTDSFSPPASSSVAVQFASAGEATLSLRCFNASGAAGAATQARFVVSGSSSGSCSLPPHPRIRPQGFTEHVRTWPQVFNGFAYPLTQSRPTPVGSFSVTLNQASSPPSAGMYLSIPVTLPADRTLRILTTLVTGTENFPGYTQPRQGNVFVALSPCAGDLRALDPQSSEVFLRCRGMMAESSVSFSSRIFPGQGCHNIPPGPYWLTVMHADPSAPGFGPFTNTCFHGDRCENGFTVDLF